MFFFISMEYTIVNKKTKLRGTERSRQPQTDLNWQFGPGVTSNSSVQEHNTAQECSTVSNCNENILFI